MKTNNKELAAQILEALYAKDKLEDVQKFVDSARTDKIDRRELQDILNRQDETFMN